MSEEKDLFKNFHMMRQTDAPIMVSFDVTSRCNLRCVHCFNDSGSEAPFTDLPPEVKLEIARQVAAIHPHNVCLCGGETLCCPNLLEIMDVLRPAVGKLSMVSNGFLMTREKAAELHAHGMDLMQISIDGANAWQHDSFRGVQGSFDRATAAVRNLVEAGISTVDVSLVPNRLNYRSLADYLAMCRDLGVHQVRMMPFLPSGRGKSIGRTLVISVPLAFFAGIGNASARGILFKGGVHIESMSHVKTAVFDKTGTLTRGDFTVTAVHPQSVTRDELLRLAAMAEGYSCHPIAEALKLEYSRKPDMSGVQRVDEISGMGICAVIDGRRIYAGNEKIMERAGVTPRRCRTAGTCVHIAADDEYLGHIVISDKLKPDSAQAISELKRLGITKTVMLTGDSPDVAQAAADEAGIDELYARQLPEDKVNTLKRLISQKQPKSCVLFAGDGINDAPVLACADIGAAMGALGSDAAVEAADVVIMDDKPSRLAEAVVISRNTMKKVRQNITFSLTIKAVVLILGAAGIANMWAAVFADVGVTLIAVINSLALLKSRRSIPETRS